MLENLRQFITEMARDKCVKGTNSEMIRRSFSSLCCEYYILFLYFISHDECCVICLIAYSLCSVYFTHHLRIISDAISIFIKHT